MFADQNLTISQMSRAELDTLYSWAAAEGWNPGLHDADAAWASDPDAFIALRDASGLIGGGSIMSLHPAFGFMGLFIVRPDRRGGGLGAQLWQYRLQRLRGRLAPDGVIGMDGVFNMVPFYAKGGFKLAHRTLRFEGIAPERQADAAALSLAELEFADCEGLDLACTPAPRTALLRQWLSRPGVRGAGLLENGELVAMGVSRPALKGYKLGPVYARSPALAERLLDTLLSGLQGQFVQIDMPEPNEAALRYAQAAGFTQSFGCARMYRGPAPALPLDRIYSVMSLEFG